MRFFVLLFSLIPSLVFSQLVVDFESGIPENWVYNTDSWGLDDQEPLSGLYSLKHIMDNTVSGTDITYLPLQALKIDKGASWRFRLRHAYNPSSSNKWAVILASDEIPDAHISGGTDNGIVLGVNLEGYDDTLKLWKLSDGNAELIAATNLNWQTDIGAQGAPELIVERSIIGEWEIYISYDGVNRILSGSGSDNTLFASAYFGIIYSYTSSCDRLLWLDDIYIDGYFEEDTLSPVISYAEFIRNNTVRVYFNEPVKITLPAANDFLIGPGEIKPDDIRIVDSRIIDLEFDSPFKNKSSYRLEATKICDLSGNCAACLAFDLLLAFPEWGDIIITEFMADPDPPVSLPEIEYIELFNRTSFPLNLKSLSLLNGKSICKFPYHILEPGEYLAVCDKEDSLLFMEELPCIGLNPLSALNNKSDYFLLCDTLSGTVYGIEYNESWYNNHFKNDGGWSFEMIDPSYPFSGASNWTFSNDKSGGTPGRINSVFANQPDIIDPYITNCFTSSPSSIRIEFSEPVSDLSKSSTSVKVDGTEAEIVEKLDSLRRSFSIIPVEDLSSGLLYTVDFVNVFDYAGNPISPSYCQTGLTTKPLTGDLIINEVLFDPLPGEPGFIEFYNRSDKVFDASSLLVACINLQSGDTGSVTYLSADARSILPGSYYVICEDKTALTENYYCSGPDNIFEVSNLTTLPDDKGRILLLRNDLEIIDDFSYYVDYHNDMLSSKSGVSLERISPQLETNNQSNWLSASGLSGWGTPGLENSVYSNVRPEEESSLSLSSSRITPDNDGYEDYLLLKFNLEEGEWIIDIKIYDDRGYRLLTLCENLSAYGTETVIWQGTGYNGMLLPSGIYIVYAEAVSSMGKVLKWKEVCTVLRR